VFARDATTAVASCCEETTVHLRARSWKWRHEVLGRELDSAGVEVALPKRTPASAAARGLRRDNKGVQLVSPRYRR
jgi:hypothetical protein